MLIICLCLIGYANNYLVCLVSGVSRIFQKRGGGQFLKNETKFFLDSQKNVANETNLFMLIICLC